VNKKYLLAGGVVVVLLLTLFALDSSSQKVTGEATSSADTKYYYCCETSSGIYWQDSCNTAAGYIRLGLNANCLDWSWKSCATVCANKFAGSTPSQDDTEKACKCTKTASTPPDTTSSDITKKYYCCKITSGGSSKVEWTDLCGGTGREILALDTNCLKWTYKSCDALCAKKVPESSIIGTSERVGASCLCRWSTGTRSGSGTSPATDSGSQQFYCCHTGIGSAPAEKAMEWIEYCSTTAGHRRLNLARYCLIGTYKSCSAFCSAKRPGSTGSKVGESCVCTGGTYSAVTEISECTIINTPGRYRLKNSITYSGDYSCMTIRADDVELDCQGPNGPYEIKRPITGTEKKGVGVNIVGDTSSLGSGIMCRKGVVVKNCKIKGFKSGVSFDHTAEDKATGRNTEYMATITKNQITGNTRGIALATWWPKFVNIYRNDIRNND